MRALGWAPSNFPINAEKMVAFGFRIVALFSMAAL